MQAGSFFCELIACITPQYPMCPRGEDISKMVDAGMWDYLVTANPQPCHTHSRHEPTVANIYPLPPPARLSPMRAPCTQQALSGLN